MPRQVEAVGTIKAGKLYIVDRVKFDDAVTHLPEGPVTLLVKSTKPKRSTKQNAYYYAIVVPMIARAMSEAYGEDVDHDETHEFLKVQFNLRTIETENGSVQLAGSTTRLDTAEFTSYVEKCRNWAAEFFGISIPDPVKIETANQPLPA